MALKDNKLTRSFINQVVKDTIESIKDGPDLKIIDIDESWSFYTNGSRLYIFHNHGEAEANQLGNTRIQGVKGIAGCTCPMPASIRVLVDMYALNNNLDVRKNTLE